MNLPLVIDRQAWLLAAAFLLTCGSVAAGAAEGSPEQQSPLDGAACYRLLREAEAAQRRFDYPLAEKLYDQVLRANPHRGDLWWQLSRCQERTQHYAAAIDSLERSLALGDDSPPGRTEYQIAVLYARQGEPAPALDWLSRALASRHEHRHVLRKDARFDALRGDATYSRLAAAATDSQLSRADQWAFDLNHLAEEAARMHVLWHDGNRGERFTAAIEQLRARIDSLSDEQLLVEIQRALVHLQDGHTLLRSVTGQKNAARVPLRFYFFSDGLHVINAAEEHADLVGCRVEQIGQTTAAEAEKLLAQLVSHDNPMGVKAGGVFSLLSPLRLQALGIIQDTSSVALTVTDRAGERRTVEIVPGTPLPRTEHLPPPRVAGEASVPLYLSRVDENLWFDRLPDNDVLYVQFNEVGDQRGRQIVDVARQLREEIASRPPRALVIDIRHNGGGNTYLYAPLLKALLYYELTQPAGQLFAIIGRDTFSAAQNFANDVDRLTEAVFVGEPTGSRPSFAGESTEVVLPYCGASISISTRLHQHAYATDRRIWIAPDVPAALSSTDYFANHDPALKAIMALVGDNKTAAQTTAP